MDASVPSNGDEYSPSSTVINFERPVPLLRGPLPVGSDDSIAGPYVLAFRDPKAWASAYRASEHSIIQQCEEGSRIGCAISASSKCMPPWWKSLLGFEVTDLKERELCEVREMESCFAAAKDKCIEFARDKCLRSFRDARIAVKGRNLSSKEAVKLIHLASNPHKGRYWVNLFGLNQMVTSHSELGVTIFRASELLGSDDHVDSILGDSGKKCFLRRLTRCIVEPVNKCSYENVILRSHGDTGQMTNSWVYDSPTPQAANAHSIIESRNRFKYLQVIQESAVSSSDTSSSDIAHGYANKLLLLLLQELEHLSSDLRC